MTKRPRGRLSFSMAPFERRWPSVLLYPVAIITNLMMTAYLFPCVRTARIKWKPHYDQLQQHTRDTNRRPIIFYSWHEYEPFIFVAFRDFPASLKPTAIGHDGLLSRMLQRTGARLGFHVWIYRRRSPIRPKEQIIDLIRTRSCNIGLIPDAGGPYRKIKPGIVEVARATSAVVVPIVTLGRPALTVRWPKSYHFPLPFSSLVVYNGKPLDGSTTTVRECQDALDSLERDARQDWSAKA